MAPRELEDGNEIDRDDDAFEDMPYDKLMAMLGDDDGDQGDAVAFGAGEAADDTDKRVTVEDGLDLIDQAQSKRRVEAKVEAAPEDKAGEAPETTAEVNEQAAPEVAKAPDDLDTMLSALDPAMQATIKTRVTAADEVLEAFKGRETELERFGTTPAKAIGELLKIEQYSRSKPDEYIAWAAGQLGGDPVATLTKAAERLGLKVTQADSGEDDPFEDPDIKAMRQELAAYRARETAPTLGPDAPQHRAQTDLEAFQREATHFQSVAPQIAALAQAHVQTTGKPATMDDIKRFYSAAVMASGLEQAAAPITPAAQAPAPVAQQPRQTQAAPSDSVERAKAASRSLDGSGQGAGRRPAIAADASLESVLSHLYDEQTKR